MLALMPILEEAGVPAGVVNVNPSRSSGKVVSTMLHDTRVRVVSFTGSTEVGRKLLHEAADNVVKPAMELGGNAPFLVFEDADIDAAIDGAMIAKMRNMGEACTSANRFYVHEKVHDEFAKKLTAKMAALKVGNGLDDGDVAAAVEGAMIAKMRNMGEACTAANRFLVHESVAREFADQLGERMGALRTGRGQSDGTDVGPLINADAVESVGRLVSDAVHDGAQLVTGGSAPDGPGHFYAPTVLLGVPAEARIVSEEIFGPVAPITTFTSDEEAVALANATEYGLASYVYTRDLARTIKLAEALQYGMVGVNTGLVSNPAAPFGGVKASGFGREGGFEGIEEYLDTTYVAIPV
jgi:acyl-CoA reductase-like NAD-dependent aldehyde dehydrogenase